MLKNKTIPKDILQSYIDCIQSKEVDLVLLAKYLAAKSNGLFEVSIIKKRKSNF